MSSVSTKEDEMNRNNEPPSLLEVVIGAAVVVGGLWAVSKMIKEDEEEAEKALAENEEGRLAM